MRSKAIQGDCSASLFLLRESSDRSAIYIYVFIYQLYAVVTAAQIYILSQVKVLPISTCIEESAAHFAIRWHRSSIDL